MMKILTSIVLITCVVRSAIGATQDATSVTPAESSKSASYDQEKQISIVKSVTRDAMKDYNLKALIAQVTVEGRQVYTEALGESMSGVSATPAMHFRNGAMAFTYIATI